MDPLSISVSVLTILSTLSVVLRNVKEFSEAPKQIDALAKDIDDLEFVVRLVAETLAAPHKNVLQGATITTTRLLARAKDELQHLEKILSRSLTVPTTGADKLKYRRFGWLREKKNVDDTRARLVTIKADLSTSLTASVL
jgi:hypothetical protein